MLRKLLAQIRALFPSELPNGVTAFHDWADSFFYLYELPTKDVNSIKFTLAGILMHLDSTTAYKSKFYFLLTMKAAAAKQVAGSVFYDIKQAQQQAQKDEAAAKAAALTINTNEQQTGVSQTPN